MTIAGIAFRRPLNQSAGSKMIRASIALLLLASTPAYAFTAVETEAIARTVYAEAGNQDAVGKTAVLETILNRYSSGKFGNSVEAVIEQRSAFEPVTKAGGWQKLPPLTLTQRTEFQTLWRLKTGGYINDVTGGATYFQNERVVADRAAAGTVKPSLVGFSGMPVTARIQDHTFYRPREAVVPARSTSSRGQVSRDARAFADD